MMIVTLLTAFAMSILAPTEDLDTLTLVMSSSDRAVVRFGASEATPGLIVVQTGDQIGRTGAVVREIAPGRLVLEEVRRGQDGRPHRAQLVFRVGHAGGERYMRDPGMDAPIGVRPEVLGPAGKARAAKQPARQ